MPMEKCPKCGSTDIEKGRIVSGKRVVFKGESQGTLSMGHEMVPFACKSCGFTEIYTEIAKRGLGDILSLPR